MLTEVSERDNGKVAECSIPDSSGKSEVISLDAALAEYAGKSLRTGVDWSAVLYELFVTNESKVYGIDGRTRYACGGMIADLVPSGLWWSIGHVGNVTGNEPAKLDLTAARRDLDWLEAVIDEAESLGLRVGCPDDIGESLGIVGHVAIALRTAEGYIVRDEVGGDD